MTTPEPHERLDYFDPSFAARAFERYARLREAGPAHCVELPTGTRAWLITRYEDARIALADRRLSNDARHAAALGATGYQDLGASDPVTGPVGMAVLSTEPPDHTRMRRVVSQAFSPRRAERWRPRVQQIADRLLDEIAPQGRADLVGEFAVPFAARVVCEFAGLPIEEVERFSHPLPPALRTTPSAPPPPRHASGGTKPNDYYVTRRYLFYLLARLRPNVDVTLPESEQPDLVSVLIAACGEGGPMTELEVVDMLSLVVNAGEETVSNMLAIGVFALLRQPDQWMLLCDRPDVLPSAVEELLRYEPPEEHTHSRVAIEDVEISGVVIPKGELVLIVIASANRDPRRFTDPDRLDLTRQDNRHLAFGHSIHVCLGAPLSRVEAEVGLGTLARRFPHLRLERPADEIAWRRRGINGARALVELPVRWDDEGA